MKWQFWQQEILTKFAQTVGKNGKGGQILVAVGSRELAAGKEFAENMEFRTYYASYEELLADRQVEAVYVATPQRLHFEDCKKCLEAKMFLREASTGKRKSRKSCTGWQRKKDYFLWKHLIFDSCRSMIK